MKAVKGNKVYTITEKQKKFYIDAGYDILDREGNVVAYGKGKSIPYEQFKTLKEKFTVLAKENSELKKTKDTTDAEVLKSLKNLATKLGIECEKVTTVNGMLKRFDTYTGPGGESNA